MQKLHKANYRKAHEAHVELVAHCAMKSIGYLAQNAINFWETETFINCLNNSRESWRDSKSLQ